jgi:hypothetical protein
VFARAEGMDLERIESRPLLSMVDRFWTTPVGRPWCDLVRRFLVYASTLDDVRRREVLDDAVEAGHLVRHTVDGESRERRREAFNTPLFPWCWSPTRSCKRASICIITADGSSITIWRGTQLSSSSASAVSTAWLARPAAARAQTRNHARHSTAADRKHD